MPHQRVQNGDCSLRIWDIMKRLKLLCLMAALLAAHSPAQTAAGKRVLVYTRQTTTPSSSYIHDNTQSSIEAIRKMGAENGFAVDASEDPNVFTAANLKRYSALIFSSTNNEALYRFRLAAVKTLGSSE